MPAVGGEGNVSIGEGGNKLVFGRLDPSFCGVGAMVEGRDVLESDVGSGLMENISEVLTRFIVKNEMSEGIRMGREVGACRLEGRDVGRRSA